MVHLWDTWSHLTDCVKSGTAVATRGPESFPEARTRAFIAAMHARARENARTNRAARRHPRRQRMLASGCSGRLCPSPYAKAYPGPWPRNPGPGRSRALAEEYDREAGCKARVRVRPGDMLTGGFREKIGVALRPSVHMWGEDDNRSLIKRCPRPWFPEGILSSANSSSTRIALAAVRAIFAINMLVGTEHGTAHTRAEYRTWHDRGRASAQSLAPIRREMCWSPAKVRSTYCGAVPPPPPLRALVLLAHCFGVGQTTFSKSPPRVFVHVHE